MAATYEITIDGKQCTCEHGEYLWDVAKRNGIYIPALCRSDAFPDHRACCRICIVEVITRGRSKVVTSCVYPVESECEVLTNSDKIREERAVLMALLKSRAPESQSIADMAAFMNADAGFERLVSVDAGKCILCGLCVQACKSLGTGAISTVNRGIGKEVNTPYGAAAPSCVGCLSCANVCPTGAIEYGQTETTRTIWNKEFALARCPECGALMGTEESVAYAAEKTGLEAPTVCDTCRKRQMADQMKQTYRFV